MTPLTRCATLGLFAAVVTSCRVESTRQDIDPDLNRMLEVPRYDPYESSSFFEDGMTMRTPPEGTVPFRSLPSQDGADLDSLTQPPMTVSLELLESGKRNFDRVCAACHGVLGNGVTVVAKHMQRPPPSLHQPRLQNLSLGQIYRVIGEGYGVMPGYASHFDDRQRWALSLYVRALQLSRHAELDRMPPELAQAAAQELSP